jgi:serine/threonine protein kinase
MADDRLFELLEHWEEQHYLGREIAPEDLAGGDGPLADQLGSWNRRLRATQWLRGPAADRGPASDQTVRPAGDQTRGGERTAPTAGRQRFLDCLAASDLLGARVLAAISAGDRYAQFADDRGLAQALIAEGLLTEYQAECLLRGDPGRLKLGSYVVQRLLGSGGMGDVFLARHRVMDRLVALKMLPAAASRRPEAVERFHREVRALARLSHPHIVAAHDAGEDRGLQFLAMEYVEGEDLQTLVARRGPLPWREAAEYIRQAALGLSYAHAQGLIHRDVKPSNLMLQSGGVSSPRSNVQSPKSTAGDLGPGTLDLGPRLKVLDLGLAAALEDVFGSLDSLTRTGAILGTVDFLAPEQSFDPAHVDARADIYSLGCTLYYLLTGRALFAGRTVGEKLLAHRDEVPDVSAVGNAASAVGNALCGVPCGANDEESGARSQGPGIRSQGSGDRDQETANGSLPPPAFLALLSALLAKSPADRPQTMSAVAAALEAILRGAPLPLPPGEGRGEGSLLPLPLGEGRGEGGNSECRIQNAETQTGRTAPSVLNSEFRILNSPLLSRRRLLTAGLATAAAPIVGLAGWRAFSAWSDAGGGTLAIRLKNAPGQADAAEILIDGQSKGIPIKAGSGEVLIPLRSGPHQVRIIAPACYHYVQDIVVTANQRIDVAPTFTPAPRWKLIPKTVKNDTLYYLALVGGPWDGYQIRVRGASGNPQKHLVILDDKPSDYGLWRIHLAPNNDAALVCAHGYFVNYCLTAGGSGDESSEMVEARVEFDLSHTPRWQIHEFANGELALERRFPSRTGYFLAPRQRSPVHQTNPDGKENYSANPAVIRIRPPDK